MLYAAAITMTLMGCNDATTDCQFISQVDKQYQSQLACEAAVPAKLQTMINAPYPVITAQCNPTGGNVAGINQPPIKISPPQKVNPTVPQTSVQAGNQENRKPLRRVLVRIENGFAYVTNGTRNVLQNLGQRSKERLRNLAERLNLRRTQVNQ